MTCLRIAVACTCGLLVPISALADEQAADTAGKQITQWIDQLTSGRFAERELATAQLIDAGQPAISAVAEMVGKQGLEATERGLHVLRQLALSDEEKTEDSARAALEKLARDEESPAFARARATLRYVNEVRQDKAIEAIKKLGGTVNETTFNQFVGGLQLVTVFSVEIDENWTGGNKGLKYIRWLPELQMVKFKGPQVTDEWVATIKDLDRLSVVELNRAKISDAAMEKLTTLPNLEQLAVKYSPITDQSVEHLEKIKSASIMMLYGTEITPEGAEKLREGTAAANVRIDYRRGAFLGVGCRQLEEGCSISQVHPNSAAEKAGLREGDIIVQYNGKDVADFQKLTDLISDNVAGDKVSIKVQRGSEQLTREVTLGEWE